jgi:hypothetical protein
MLRSPLALTLVLGFTAAAWGDPPTDAAARAKVIGQPTALVVQPAEVLLEGPRSLQQMIVTGKYADGTVRDLTPLVEYAIDGPLASVEAEGMVAPLSNGLGKLTIKAGDKSATIPVKVQNFEANTPVSFRNDVIASLNVGGCNMGACHGTPSGKNGFKLSLRGYDPTSDYIQLTRDVLGRRTDRNGESSLLLLKGLGRVAHEGGSRFPASSVAAQMLARWFAEGLRDDEPTLPSLSRIDILPGARQLKEPSRWQQLAIVGHFSDGSKRDVTRLSVFTSSDENIAKVSPTGLVEFNQSGEVAITVRYLMELVPVRIIYLEPKPGFKWTNPPANNYVDEHAFNKLKMLNILPSDVCTDQEFIRRVYLDICGILPSADDVQKFLDSKDPARRAKLVDDLLERPEYADFWTLKWSDVFRSTKKTLQAKGTRTFQNWFRGNLDRNTSFDEVLREVITAGGSTFSNPAASYYRVARDPQSLAETTAQLFFGIRLQCSKCHNHPFERWTQDDYYGMAAWFARVKLRPDALEGGDKEKKGGAEVVYSSREGEVTQPRTGKVMQPKFMGGPAAAVPPNHDRREVLATWMTSADNAFVPKSIVNRVWFHLMGKGIVDPVDDFRDSNPSANDELLDALAKDFVAKKWDLKHVIRTIVNSRTYQLSAQTNEFNKDDNKYFSHAVTKLLTAEQLLDAICGVTERPEIYKGYPAGTRSVQLTDGEANHPFLKAFGQPARELACECEREGESNLAQALQLINGATVNDRLRDPANRIGKLLDKKTPEPEMLKTLFLVTLSRPPSAAESTAMLGHVAAAMDKRKAWEDVHWALINSKEFLFRH